MADCACIAAAIISAAILSTRAGDVAAFDGVLRRLSIFLYSCCTASSSQRSSRCSLINFLMPHRISQIGIHKSWCRILTTSEAQINIIALTASLYSAVIQRQLERLPLKSTNRQPQFPYILSVVICTRGHDTWPLRYVLHFWWLIQISFTALSLSMAFWLCGHALPLY